MIQAVCPLSPVLPCFRAVSFFAAAPLSPQGVTDALKNNEVAAYEKTCTSDLMRIVDLVRGELTNLQRATLGERRREGLV